MLSINEMAASITASRTDFGLLFMRAQAGLPSERRTAFEVAASSADDREAFAQALRHAQVQEWLDTLIDALIDARLEDGHLADDVRREAGNAHLEAIANSLSLFMQPHLVAKGIDDGLQWTGKLVVDGGASQGTCVLIAHNRVLTAWHVVKGLFRPAAAGGYEPVPDGGGRFEVFFDDFLESVGRGRGLRGRGSRRVGGHEKWCVAYSTCHEEELASHLPADLATLEGFWDYAIIRLAEPIGFERGWADMNPNAGVPLAKQKMVLIQHPAGQSMRMAIDDVADAEEAQRASIPRLRFLHYVNSLPGSSGGPCFDTSLLLFGLHQGEWNGAARVTNRGVPIARVLEHIDATYGGLRQLEPEESLVWELGREMGRAPVIGCDDFQQEVLQSAFLGKPKLFVIGGEKGSGKTFRVNVLAAMLPDSGHLKIRLEAAAVSKMDAAELARVICSNAGTTLPTLAPPSEVRSTGGVWLKDEVVWKVVQALDQVRGQRRVWLTITDLNAYDIEGEDAPNMLLLLYEQVLTNGWLRVVLDGMKGDIPAAFNEILFRHRAREITVEQIETYLRRLATRLRLTLGAATFQIESMRLFDFYVAALDANRATAADLLAKEVMKTANYYMRVAPQG